MFKIFFEDFEKFGREFGKDFNDFFNEKCKPYFSAWPKVDVYENDKEYKLKVELPGVKKEDINISVKDSSIKLTGKINEEDEKEYTIYSKERKKGDFEKIINLEEKINGDKSTADFKDGILTIKVPKSAESKTVNINVN